VSSAASRERGFMTGAFQGVIRSQSKTAAEAKLGLLTSAVLAAWGGTPQLTKKDERWSFVSANADGDIVSDTTLDTAASGFLELSFEQEYLLASDYPFTFSMQYSLRRSWDWLTLELSTTVSGSCFASGTVLTAMLNRDALNLLDAFLTNIVPGSVVTKEERGIDHEWVNTTTPTDRTQKLDFSASYVGAITGPSGVIEADLTEATEYSGTRWVVQPVPDGPSVVQDCGIEPGRRTVSGFCTAATSAAAITWAKARWTPTEGGFATPPKIDVASMLLPRIGTGAGTVRLYKAAFTFAEILPNYSLS